MIQVYYEGLSESRVDFKVSALPGHETPTSYHNITLDVLDKDGNDVEVTIQMTNAQIVQIVRHFFWNVIAYSKGDNNRLIALLRKRWHKNTNTADKRDSLYRKHCTKTGVAWNGHGLVLEDN